MIAVGIDPGATAGIVALLVDTDRPGDRSAWRWLGSDTVTKSTKKHETEAEHGIAQFWKATRWIKRLGVAVLASDVGVCAIERPADVAGWAKGQGQGQRVQRTGTAFALGSSYGMLAAAASVAGCRVHAYLVREWMPKATTGHLKHTQKRERTLEQLAAFALEIRRAPADGMLADGWDAPLDENVLMALGVLVFHLDAQVR